MIWTGNGPNVITLPANKLNGTVHVWLLEAVQFAAVSLWTVYVTAYVVVYARNG